MTDYKAHHIAEHFREREKVDDLMEIFSRAFATECGETIPDNWLYTETAIWAGVVTVKFEYSDQCGTETQHVKFPIEAFDGGPARTNAIVERRGKIEEAAEKERLRQQAADRAEVDRTLARIERRQNERAAAMGLGHPIQSEPTDAAQAAKARAAGWLTPAANDPASREARS